MNNSAKITEALGNSDVFLAFQEQLSHVAKADRPVLIVGERGTGKELAAARLHYLSHRWQAPLITLNCASLAENLLQTELFGHEAGAYTGASARRAGRFELAHSGTLFLDEIAIMPLNMQEAVLRATEYGSFERVGGSKTITVDVRLVAATNADLPALAQQGKFKADLLDRLSFEVLTLPPLRERGDDILLLANYFAAKMAVECSLQGEISFSQDAMRQLRLHSWPGNIRELKNTIERSVFRQGTTVTDIIIDPFDSPWRPQMPVAPAIHTAPNREIIATAEISAEAPTEAPFDTSVPDPTQSISLPLKQATAQLECQYLQTALQHSRYNQRQAAKLLGISYDQFRGLYRKHKNTITP